MNSENYSEERIQTRDHLTTATVFGHVSRIVEDEYKSFFFGGDLLCYHNSSLEPRWFGGGQRTSTAASMGSSVRLL